MTGLVTNGDAVSRLTQLISRRHGISLRWTGEGDEDLSALCLDYKSKEILCQCLWGGIKEILALESFKAMPEDVQAVIYSIVLKAQANFELELAGVKDKATKAKT